MRKGYGAKGIGAILKNGDIIIPAYLARDFLLKAGETYGPQADGKRPEGKTSVASPDIQIQGYKAGNGGWFAAIKSGKPMSWARERESRPHANADKSDALSCDLPDRTSFLWMKKLSDNSGHGIDADFHRCS